MPHCPSDFSRLQMSLVGTFYNCKNEDLVRAATVLFEAYCKVLQVCQLDSDTQPCLCFKALAHSQMNVEGSLIERQDFRTCSKYFYVGPVSPTGTPDWRRVWGQGSPVRDSRIASEPCAIQGQGSSSLFDRGPFVRHGVSGVYLML